MTGEPSSSKLHFDPLGTVWRFLADPRTLMGWMALLAFALALAALRAQLAPQTAGSGLTGQSGTLLQALGQFDLAHSPWFLGLLMLAALSLLVRTIDSAEFAWRAWAGQGWAATSLGCWGQGVAQHTILGDDTPGTTCDKLQDHLRQRGYHWFEIPGMAWPNAVVSRRPVALWARPVVYGAALVTLVGVAVLTLWGWQHGDWQPNPGQSLAVGHGFPYEVRLDDFVLQAAPDGRLPTAVSLVAWLEEGEVMKQDKVSSGRPAHLTGIAVRQIGFAPAVKMRAWDEEERLLVLRPVGTGLGAPGEIEVVFSSLEAQPLILIPALDEMIALAFDPGCRQGRPALKASLIGAGGSQQTELGVLQTSGTLEAERLRLSVELAYRPILRVDYRPAMGVVVGGMVLTLLALLAGWLVPARILWIAVGPGPESASAVQILAPAHLPDHSWLVQWVCDLEKVLTSHD